MPYDMSAAEALEPGLRAGTQVRPTKEMLRALEGDIRRSRPPWRERGARRRPRRRPGLWAPLLGAIGVLATLYFVIF